MPSAGKGMIREDGSIVVVGLKFGNYTCATQSSKTTLDSNKMECSKTAADIMADFPAA